VIRCVVFDVDDTLYLERDYVRSGFRAVAEWVRATLGREDFLDRAWTAFEGGVRGSVFDHVLAEYGVAPNGIVAELVEVYRTHRPAISLLPDARGCLDRLRGPFRLAAVTGGPAESQRAKVEALGLSGWLDPILLTHELGEGFAKPSTESFRVVEEMTGLAGDTCAYVADNPAIDFAGPGARGWRTIRVRRSGSLHEGVEAPGADAEVADLSDLEVHL
jgi:putative hydrolase of the HAD superfamily